MLRLPAPQSDSDREVSRIPCVSRSSKHASPLTECAKARTRRLQNAGRQRGRSLPPLPRPSSPPARARAQPTAKECTHLMLRRLRRLLSGSAEYALRPHPLQPLRVLATSHVLWHVLPVPSVPACSTASSPRLVGLRSFTHCARVRARGRKYAAPAAQPFAQRARAGRGRPRASPARRARVRAPARRGEARGVSRRPLAALRGRSARARAWLLLSPDGAGTYYIQSFPLTNLRAPVPLPYPP